MAELHADLELTDGQRELLEEIEVDPSDLYPIRLRKPGDYSAPGGTGWADPVNNYLVFVNGEPGRFRYWMGEERAELVVKMRDVTVYQISEERLEYHPDPRDTEAA